MAFTAYLNTPFQYSHERRAFDTLWRELEGAWSDREEPCFLFGNFVVGGKEPDAFLIKSDAIVVIDFKNFGGELTFSQNGAWKCGGASVKGGSHANPLDQLSVNRRFFREYLKTEGIYQHANRDAHVSCLALFNRPIEFDREQIPPQIRAWFNVCGMDHAVETLEQFTTHRKKNRLTESERARFIASLNPREYSPAGVRPPGSLSTDKEAEAMSSERIRQSDSGPTPSTRERPKASRALGLAHVYIPITNGAPLGVKQVGHYLKYGGGTLSIYNVDDQDKSIPNRGELIAGVLAKMYPDKFPNADSAIAVGFEGPDVPDDGDSYQLPVFIAAAVRLTGGFVATTSGGEGADGLKEIIWASGTIESDDFERHRGQVGCIEELANKIEKSRLVFSAAAKRNLPIRIVLPAANESEHSNVRKQLASIGLSETNYSLNFVSTVEQVYPLLGLAWPEHASDLSLDEPVKQAGSKSAPDVTAGSGGPDFSQQVRRRHGRSMVAVMGLAVLAVIALGMFDFETSPLDIQPNTVEATIQPAAGPPAIVEQVVGIADYSAFGALSNRGHCPLQQSAAGRYRSVEKIYDQRDSLEFQQTGLCRLRLLGALEKGGPGAVSPAWAAIVVTSDTGQVVGESHGIDLRPKVSINSPDQLVSGSYHLLLLSGTSDLKSVVEEIRRGIAAGETPSALRDLAQRNGAAMRMVAYNLVP